MADQGHIQDSECRELRREVLVPGRQSSGMAVIIVAAATMFFAVAGAAFALQARMAACPYEKQEPARVRVDSAEPCDRVVVVKRGDSTVVVHHPSCSGR